MPITATELKTARFMANLTQAELAERVGVSQRTVVNWEREGGRVPAKAESSVRHALSIAKEEGWAESPEAQRELPEWLNLDGTNENSDLDVRIRTAYQSARASMSTQDGASALASLAIFGTLVLDFAENAAKIGAHPLNVLDIIEGAASVIVETGAFTLPAELSGDAVKGVLVRGTELARKIVDDYEPDPVKLNAYRITMDDPRRDLMAKLRAAQTVSGLVQDTAAVDPEVIPDDVESKWGLAAHPKTDLPEDHTP